MSFADTGTGLNAQRPESLNIVCAHLCKILKHALLVLLDNVYGIKGVEQKRSKFMIHT
jgi:hypothetical protein